MLVISKGVVSVGSERERSGLVSGLMAMACYPRLEPPETWATTVPQH